MVGVLGFVGGMGVPELLILLVLILLIFGAGKLPEVAGQLGSGIRNFQKSLKNSGEDEKPKQLENDSTEQKTAERENVPTENEKTRA